MARVQIDRQSWGTVQDEFGTMLNGLAVVLKNTGTLTSATHYSAITGGTSSTADLVTVNGRIKSPGSSAPRFVDVGTYDITIDGVTDTVEAIGGGGAGGAGAPTGSATGDLTGSYPSPTVKASVALTGNPTAPTQTAGNSSTRIATTAFVGTAVAAKVTSSEVTSIEVVTQAEYDALTPVATTLYVVSDGGTTDTFTSDAIAQTRFVAGGGDVVATRPGVCATSGFTTADQASNVQSAHVSIRDVNSVRLYYLNGHHETDNVNDLSVTAQVSAGAAGAAPFNKVFFGGKRTVVIEPGGSALSDPVAIDLPAGTTFYVHTYQDAGPGGSRIQNHNGFQTNEFGNNTASDQTGTQLTTGTTTGLIPTYIVAGRPSYVAEPMIGIFGDSIADGRYDTNLIGYIARALQGDYGYIQGALPSERVVLFISSFNGIKRQGRADGITAAICEHGINDVTFGSTVPQITSAIASMTALARRAGAKKVMYCTILPTSSSTDSWATAVNQTPGATVAVRTALNDELRANYASYGIDFLFDAADVVEVNSAGVLTRNGGRWVPAYAAAPMGGGGSADGTHPSIAGHLALSNALKAFLVANPTFDGVVETTP